MVATSRMANYYATPILPLARGKVRYVGEPVVGIVAESRYQAEDASELIAIEYEPLPRRRPIRRTGRVPVRRFCTTKPAPTCWSPANSRAATSTKRLPPRRCASAAASACIGRRRSRWSRGPASPSTTPSREALTLHSATHVPGIVRDALATALELPGRPYSRRRAGRRRRLRRQRLALSGRDFCLCRGAAARRAPVKWTSDRLEDLTANSQAFDEIVDAELALDHDGRIAGLRADVIGDVGAYSIYPWTAALEPVQVVSFLPGPYRVQHYRGRVQAVATSKAPTGPYRGVGRPISTFVMERLMDMAAVEARHRRQGNPATQSGRATDELPYKVASGIVWDKSGFQECLDAACDAIGYDSFAPEQRRRAPPAAGSASASPATRN